jgi:hypothetical protein
MSDAYKVINKLYNKVIVSACKVIVGYKVISVTLM